MPGAAAKTVSPNGRGGARPGSGRKKKTDQNDAYVLIAKARAKNEAYKAQITELEFREKTRELVRIDEVASEWVKQVTITKARFLALPTAIAPDLHEAGTAGEVEQILREQITAILADLSHGYTPD